MNTNLSTLNGTDDFVWGPNASIVNKITEAQEAFESSLRSVFAKNESDEGFSDNIELVLYRQGVMPFLTWLKLHSSLLYSNAIDIAVTDNLNAEYRFTVRYIIQSTTNNNTISVATKTNEVLVIASTQALFPALN
jgi:NADH:ubiquinone oxidoreductase subunit C